MNPNEAKPLLVLPLLRDGFTVKNYDGLLLGLSSALFFVAVLFSLIKWAVLPDWVFALVLFLLAIMCLFLFRRMMPDWAKIKDIVGTCSFYADKIEVATKDNINQYEIQSTVLRVISNFYRGLADGKYSSHNGILSIVLTKGEASLNITTILRTKNEYEQMIDVLAIWYKTGVSITELCTEEQLSALLLKTNYSYVELQAAKADLGIS